MDDLREFLHGMLPPHDCHMHREDDHSKWEQMSQLTQEELGKKRALNARTAEIETELDLLKKKYEMLKAEREVLNTEWWVNLKKAHGLPQETEYFIEADGRILMAPKEK